jgi:GNAT superfamily N-acetyltransferase
VGEGPAELRRALPADAAAVRELVRAAYTRWARLIGREPKPMIADYAAAIENHLVDLLHVGGELVGVIEMIPQPDHLLIENVAVRPASQGRGHGRRLLAHAERTALALGHRETRLYTNKLFVENVQLYARLGYEIAFERPLEGRVLVHMRKALRDPADGGTPPEGRRLS